MAIDQFLSLRLLFTVDAIKFKEKVFHKKVIYSVSLGDKEVGMGERSFIMKLFRDK